MNIIKKYIVYLKDNPEHFWFKRKLYGWGWAPATREGFMMTFMYLFVIVILAFRLDENTLPKTVLYEIGLPLIVFTAFFIFIAYKKGERPKWQWGNDASDEDY